VKGNQEYTCQLGCLTDRAADEAQGTTIPATDANYKFSWQIVLGEVDSVA